MNTAGEQGHLLEQEMACCSTFNILTAQTKKMIKAILRFHLTRYPAMQIQDVYKLLYQAAMGSEHAVSDIDSARNWLTSELAEMEDGPPEPLIDPISADGGIVRVHLRPFFRAGHNPDALLEAFVHTANGHHGDIRLLEEYWRAAMATAKFPAREMEEFFRSMKEQDYPAMHHSSEYEKLYRPAYRVVLLTICPKTWLKDYRQKAVTDI